MGFIPPKYPSPGRPLSIPCQAGCLVLTYLLRTSTWTTGCHQTYVVLTHEPSCLSQHMLKHICNKLLILYIIMCCSMSLLLLRYFPDHAVSIKCIPSKQPSKWHMEVIWEGECKLCPRSAAHCSLHHFTNQECPDQLHPWLCGASCTSHTPCDAGNSHFNVNLRAIMLMMVLKFLLPAHCASSSLQMLHLS